MMKQLYLFLDFDGVLNGAINNFGRDQNTRFDKSNLEIFDELIKELKKYYELKIIINSSWKITNKNTKQWIEKFLNKENNPLKKYQDLIIDATPTYYFYDKKYNCKMFEVESYIVQNLNNTENKEFLIIDDEKISKGYMSFIKIYKTDEKTGLVENDIYNVMNILKPTNIFFNFYQIDNNIYDNYLDIFKEV